MGRYIRGFDHVSLEEQEQIVADIRDGLGIVAVKEKYRRDYYLLINLIQSHIEGWTPREHWLLTNEQTHQKLKEERSEKKQCSRCKRVKGVKSYSIDKKAIGGRSNLCKQCAKKKTRQWLKRVDTSSEDRKRRSKDAALKRAYGVTLEEYDAMLAAQGFQCFLCDGDITGINANLDHCHATGKIRKLLCNSCNRALGFFKERPDVLRRAADYVESY